MDLRWRHIVVFDGIGRAHDFGSFKTGNTAYNLDLHIFGQAHRQAIEIDFKGVIPFGLEKNLMPILVGKTHNFVLYRGAISRSYPLDASAVHGRAIQIVANNIVRFLHGHCEMTTELLLLNAVGMVGKGSGVGIAGLLFACVKVDAARIDARWGAGFEPSEFKAKLREAIRCFVGCLLTCATRAVGKIAHMNEALEEGACGQNYGFGSKNRFGFGNHALNTSVFDHEIFE